MVQLSVIGKVKKDEKKLNPGVSDGEKQGCMRF